MSQHSLLFYYNKGKGLTLFSRLLGLSTDASYPKDIEDRDSLSDVFGGREGGGGRLYIGYDFLKIESQTSIQSEVNL